MSHPSTLWYHVPPFLSTINSRWPGSKPWREAEWVENKCMCVHMHMCMCVFLGWAFVEMEHMDFQAQAGRSNFPWNFTVSTGCQVSPRGRTGGPHQSLLATQLYLGYRGTSALCQAISFPGPRNYCTFVVHRPGWSPGTALNLEPNLMPTGCRHRAGPAFISPEWFDSIWMQRTGWARCFRSPSWHSSHSSKIPEHSEAYTRVDLRGNLWLRLNSDHVSLDSQFCKPAISHLYATLQKMETNTAKLSMLDEWNSRDNSDIFRTCFLRRKQRNNEREIEVGKINFSLGHVGSPLVRTFHE